MSSILGVGIDIVDLARFREIHARHGDRFVDRFCRPGEVETRVGPALVQHLGGLFAAKEAVLKALGTGWAEGLSFRQVEVARDRAGAPTAVLHERAKELASARGVSRVHLSISHERTHAVAFAVLEREDAHRSEAT